MTTDDQDLDPDALDCDEDLSVWTEHDEPVEDSPESSDHPLSEPLALVADVSERLQTWASDLANTLRRRGGRMTLEELEEGRQLSLRVKEAFIVAVYLGRNM